MEYFKDLKKNMYTRPHYPPTLKATVEDGLRIWQKFCELPEPEKLAFAYSNTEDFGYELKKQKGKTLDVKENLHYNMHGEEALDIKNKFSNRAVRELMDISSKVLTETKKIVLDVADDLEKKGGLDNCRKELEDGFEYWTLRYLHYFPTDAGSSLASAHPDRGGMTLHLIETDSGLEYLNENMEWIPLNVEKGSALLFGGLQFQLRTDNQIKAACHRATASEKTSKTDRYVIVLFIPFMQTAFYNKDRVGRTQDLKPGFNYTLSYTELEKYFST